MEHDDAWARAIFHIDADGFFASCHQSVYAHMQGRPVITGAERGIITSVSKEAKKLGIHRGVTPWDARRICPDIIFAESDFRLYRILSNRMMSIVRTYTPVAEQYSIDEVFADITGIHRMRGQTYEQLARAIKLDVQAGLGLTVSVGVSLTKTIAKTASSRNKPDGCTIVAPHEIDSFLCGIPMSHIWGVGRQTAAYLACYGIYTVGDFLRTSYDHVSRTFDKPVCQLWAELRGQYAHRVGSRAGATAQSMSRVRTMNQPTSSMDRLWDEIALGIEHLCHRLRACRAGARKVSLILKDTSFRVVSLSWGYSIPTAYERDMVEPARAALHTLLRAGGVYRATGLVCHDIAPLALAQSQLFDTGDTQRNAQVSCALDMLRAKYKTPVVRTGIVGATGYDRYTITELSCAAMMPVAPVLGSRTRLAFMGS